MDFLPEKISAYAEQHSNVCKSPVLDELERKTHLEVLLPQMLSGQLQGDFLAFFTRLQKPSCILEIGTYTGYSAICMAQGLAENGKLHTIDVDEERQDLVTEFVEKAGLGDKIVQYIGKAIELIPTMDMEFDLVFIDADKANYVNYYELVFPKLKKGGYIIADNVLWSGRVAEPGKKDKRTQVLDDFNKHALNDARVKNLLLPLRDGLMLIEKISD